MKSASKTDIGISRKENQDASIILSNPSVIFASVCDGMGGHPGGSQAAKLTIKAFKKLFKKNPPNDSDEAKEWIEKCYIQAKKYMIKESNRDSYLLDMGTTTTSILIYKEFSIIFNVGDSRVYAYNNTLHQITEDHNLMNYYIQHQGMSKEKAQKINSAAALTSALGPTKDIRVSSYQVSNKDVNFFILTSDGIHDFIGKASFELLLSQNTNLDKTLSNLIKIAIQNGSSDNLTAVILELEI